MYRTSLLLAVGLGLALVLSACGANETKKSDLPSRGTDRVSHGKLAECSQIVSNSSNITGQISTYYDNGSLITNYIYMNLTGVPAELLSSSEDYLSIYRWSERLETGRNENTIPVRMHFINKLTGQVSNSQAVDRISGSVFQTIIQNQQLNVIGITPTNFLEQHYVLLTGMEIQWDAMTLAHYQNGQVAGAAHALLPAFSADPNVYAQNNPSPNLQALHPNHSYRNSGATESDFFSLTEQYCAAFLQGMRFPASQPNARGNQGFFSNIINFFLGLQQKFADILSSLRDH